jgi:Fe-S cluster assembly protein SufD
VEIERLALAGGADIHWARDTYGVLEARGQKPVERPLAALNSAFATDGLLIRVTGKANKPISLIYAHKSESSDAILHHCIKLEEGAELTVLENGPAAARFSKVMEVEVGAGARFHHIRSQGRDHQRRAVTHVFARLGAGALFKSFTLTANGVMTRNEAVLELVGDDAQAHIAGAAVGDGDFHHDDTVFVTHQGQRCESRQVFKKVLKNGAVGVFQGKIIVQPHAQKTDGRMASNAVLLSEDAAMYNKPELEIFADDVACAHGATCGALDDDLLFYLMSRGISKADAEALMVESFVGEAIDFIGHEAVREVLHRLVRDWLEARAARAQARRS